MEGGVNCCVIEGEYSDWFLVLREYHLFKGKSEWIDEKLGWDETEDGAGEGKQT